jgi:hypothetical protein
MRDKSEMTGPDRDHRAVVGSWLQRAAHRGSVASQIEAFEHAFARMWQRSRLTLGEVTLTAIVDRVLHTANEQFPFLASVAVDASGLRCQELRSHAGVPEDQVSAALRFVLVEFLTVLGNLTAQILTPALHAELSTEHARASDSGTSEDEES